MLSTKHKPEPSFSFKEQATLSTFLINETQWQSAEEGGVTGDGTSHASLGKDGILWERKRLLMQLITMLPWKRLLK